MHRATLAGGLLASSSQILFERAHWVGQQDRSRAQAEQPGSISALAAVTLVR